MQDNGAGDDGEHALQAQQDGDHRGVGVLLGQDLQGIAHAAGEHAHIQQGPDAVQQHLEADGVEKQGQNGGPGAGKQELQAAELHTVAEGGEVVNNQDVHGEAYSTYQHQQVAGGQGEAALDTQQVQRAHGQGHGDPHRQADLPAEEQAEHRHQHHIQGGDEPGLAAVGTGHQARLLEVGGNCQHCAAAEAAQPQLPALGLLLLRGDLGPVLPEAA